MFGSIVEPSDCDTSQDFLGTNSLAVFGHAFPSRSSIFSIRCVPHLQFWGLPATAPCLSWNSIEPPAHRLLKGICSRFLWYIFFSTLEYWTLFLFPKSISRLSWQEQRKQSDRASAWVPIERERWIGCWAPVGDRWSRHYVTALSTRILSLSLSVWERHGNSISLTHLRWWLMRLPSWRAGVECGRLLLPFL